jgi:hypothetical protein
MQTKCFYKGYHLACITTPADNGMFRARVAVMALSADRTRSQRFIDMETFPDESQADARALTGGKEWVEAQLRREQLEAPTNFAAL